MTEEVDVDDLIERLLTVRGSRLGREVDMSEIELVRLCRSVREVFLEQPMLLELDPPIKIGGDIHGQFADLLQIFEHAGYPPAANYIFLGDYVDRGRHQIETISLMLSYKLKFSENFFMLRGNHENENINRIYGFKDECERRFSTHLYDTFNGVFNTMPIAAIIGEKIMCMHGGISSELTHLDQIRNIERPVSVPRVGVICDLLWADPDDQVVMFGPSDRGISTVFGPAAAKAFLKHFKLDLICRAHQVVADGYEFFCKRRVVTIFSAPNYCGMYDNAGAIMSVDEDMTCSFQILKPSDERKAFNRGLLQPLGLSPSVLAKLMSPIKDRARGSTPSPNKVYSKPSRDQASSTSADTNDSNDSNDSNDNEQ